MTADALRYLADRIDGVEKRKQMKGKWVLKSKEELVAAFREHAKKQQARRG